MEVKCPFCNKIFTRKNSLVKRSKINFCSSECCSKSRIKRTEVICNICNKKFTKQNKDIQRSNKNYCSRECWNKKRTERNIFCIKCNQIIDTSTIYYSKKYCKKCYSLKNILRNMEEKLI